MSRRYGHRIDPAEAYANDMVARGCGCGNNGGGDCIWCQDKRDWEINDHAWRMEAWPRYRQWYHAKTQDFDKWLWLTQEEPA